ncbi:helix-turn-helix domain-containing protein [Bacillus thuringiensis serovar andalousiensis]|uniref:Helix-turn-helix domain-containing protein n=2 Tax=Bacillus TaxID=1386 RepID=A0A9X6Q3H6_BACTU|nr:helix-turn-helix domain-containing protein [Bacillus thuringiensis]OTX22925.1 helix-turn-helix domain-containing protein [Bacillus thuringiensis serovar andalousiensis]OTZ23239.1 helix-turn-helix domain-containing protein [Bacillus thuringiensis serovar aizawai]MRC59834.1 helix-turn-helix domain-containing protein [Bacillus thuringiensis]MRC77353.1 helix-turn-helix domain-containing protein [Bacillus thuringiensis]
MYKTMPNSKKREFIYNSSYNKGHISTPSMVAHCIGLSTHAKLVYSNILNYIYKKGEFAFPSIYRLSISCSCSINTIIRYINELVEKGFIKKEVPGRGKSNRYYIIECDKIPLLKVSEMMWEVIDTLAKKYGWKDIMKCKNSILSFLNQNKYSLHHMEIQQNTINHLNALFLHVLEKKELDIEILTSNFIFKNQSII